MRAFAMTQVIPDLYPLRFKPILRRYIWGGRKLGERLSKPIGPENDYAESWEVCDHGTDQSVVAFGPLAGATLGELVRDRGQELLGRHNPQRPSPTFLMSAIWLRIWSPYSENMGSGHDGSPQCCDAATTC